MGLESLSIIAFFSFNLIFVLYAHSSSWWYLHLSQYRITATFQECFQCPGVMVGWECWHLQGHLLSCLLQRTRPCRPHTVHRSRAIKDHFQSSRSLQQPSSCCCSCTLGNYSVKSCGMFTISFSNARVPWAGLLPGAPGPSAEPGHTHHSLSAWLLPGRYGPLCSQPHTSLRGLLLLFISPDAYSFLISARTLSSPNGREFISGDFICDRGKLLLCFIIFSNLWPLFP